MGGASCSPSEPQGRPLLELQRSCWFSVSHPRPHFDAGDVISAPLESSRRGPLPFCWLCVHPLPEEHVRHPPSDVDGDAISALQELSFVLELSPYCQRRVLPRPLSAPSKEEWESDLRPHLDAPQVLLSPGLEWSPCCQCYVHPWPLCAAALVERESDLRPHLDALQVLLSSALELSPCCQCYVLPRALCAASLEEWGRDLRPHLDAPQVLPSS